MTKTTFIFLVLLLFGLNLKSQEKVFLYLNSNWEVTTKNKGCYYRNVEYDFDEFKLNGKVSDHDSLNTLLMEGNYSQGKKDGDFIFYYKNGRIKSKGKYNNNERIGRWEYYYSNGKLKQNIMFPEDIKKDRFSVVEFYDINGNQLIKNGTGKWLNDSIYTSMMVDPSSLKRLIGNFKDSLLHGEWKLYRISDGLLMGTERFRKGKYRGTTVLTPLDYYGDVVLEMMDKCPDENESKFNITEKFKVDSTAYSESLINSDVETIFRTITGKEFKIKNRRAGYPDGDLSLFDFIGQNILYPISAIESKISGKVYVSITIDSNGKTKEVKILKGIQNDLDLEAIRVVKLIKNWLPKIQDGKAIESTITIPIKFDLK